uniref:G protein-coupled receptor n=1 Tax=Heterorhabditis bacteriophora TaxID=37862 RepID=A0A1I7WMZ0_HETBA
MKFSALQVYIAALVIYILTTSTCFYLFMSRETGFSHQRNYDRVVLAYTNLKEPPQYFAFRTGLTIVIFGIIPYLCVQCCYLLDMDTNSYSIPATLSSAVMPAFISATVLLNIGTYRRAVLLYFTRPKKVVNVSVTTIRFK